MEYDWVTWQQPSVNVKYKNLVLVLKYYWIGFKIKEKKLQDEQCCNEALKK